MWPAAPARGGAILARNRSSERIVIGSIFWIITVVVVIWELRLGRKGGATFRARGVVVIIGAV